MPSAEDMAQSFEAGTADDQKLMGGCGGKRCACFTKFHCWNKGKHRTKAEQGQKQAAHADPSKKAVSSIVAGENARKTN